MRPLKACLFLLVGTLPAASQVPHPEEVAVALHRTFSNLNNIELKYATTKTGAAAESGSFLDEFKFRDNRFLLSQETIKPDSSKSQEFEIAYDGKLYQSLDSSHQASVGLTPKYVHLPSLTATPILRLFVFVHPDSWDNVNPLAYFRTLTNWQAALKKATITKREKLDGKELVDMTLTDKDGTYIVKLRPDLNYLPVEWRWSGKATAGFTSVFKASSFQQFVIDGTKITFPTDFAESLIRPDGTIAHSKAIKITSLVPMTTPVSDDSSFRIDSFAASVFDTDAHKFLK